MPSVWCFECDPNQRTLIGDYDDPSKAAHDHIDRTHPTQEDR